MFLWIDETRHQAAGALPDARTDYIIVDTVDTSELAASVLGIPTVLLTKWHSVRTRTRNKTLILRGLRRKSSQASAWTLRRPRPCAKNDRWLAERGGPEQPAYEATVLRIAPRRLQEGGIPGSAQALVRNICGYVQVSTVYPPITSWACFEGSRGVSLGAATGVRNRLRKWCALQK